MSETKVGRPTKYDPKYCEQAMKLCLLGHTNEELAAYFEVAVSTISLWMAEYPEFSGAIKDGRENADSEVVHSLYRRAKGYSHPDTHIAVSQGEVIATPIEKHYPPDTAAAFIWLKNRRPQKWRDKQEVEHTGKLETTMNPDNQYELARRIAFVLSRADKEK